MSTPNPRGGTSTIYQNLDTPSYAPSSVIMQGRDRTLVRKISTWTDACVRSGCISAERNPPKDGGYLKSATNVIGSVADRSNPGLEQAWPNRPVKCVRLSRPQQPLLEPMLADRSFFAALQGD